MTGKSPKVRPGLDIRPVDDGVVVHEREGGHVVHLNDSAAAILHWCDGTRSLAAIAEAVTYDYGLTNPPLPQVESCVRAMADAGLLA